MDELTAWLRQNAISVEPGSVESGADDLRPIKKLLHGVQIVGLGEVTHGTKEFFQIRHRLLKFLVVEMGFNTLAIEGSYSAAESVNEYILSGKGDRRTVLTGLGSVMWDVEEFAEVVDWLRAHNESVADTEKVRFFGADIFYTRLGRERVLAYLRVVAPQRVASTEGMFRTIAEGEARGLLVAHELIGKDLVIQLRSLLEFFEVNAPAFTGRTSVDEYEHIVRHLRVILQWVSSNRPEELPERLPRSAGLNNYARSMYMAENLIHFIERDAPHAKVVLWAHNLHVSVGFEDIDGHGLMPNMGHYLRERFGERYYAFGLDMGDGSYLAREWSLPGKALGDLTVADVVPAPAGSVSWHLSQADSPSFMLDLRESSAPLAVEQWLTAPQTMQCLGWAHCDPPLMTRVVLKNHYDGIIFIKTTSATTPTANALDTVLHRASH